MKTNRARRGKKIISGMAAIMMAMLFFFMDTAPATAANENSQEELVQEICFVKNTLWSNRAESAAGGYYPVETNLGDLAADAFRFGAKSFLNGTEALAEYAGAPIIGAVHSGAIQQTIPNGSMTADELTKVFPLSDPIVLTEITPAILYDALENSVSGIDGQDAETGRLISDSDTGEFLQISGIRFVYDPAAPTGNKVQAIYLDEGNGMLEAEDVSQKDDLLKNDTESGEEEMVQENTANNDQTEFPDDTYAAKSDGVLLDRTDETTKLIFASNSHVLMGEEGYSMITDLPVLGELDSAAEIIEEYIRDVTDNGSDPLNMPTNGRRIIVAGSHDSEEYDAMILVKKEGKPAANEEVNCYVDGLEFGRTKTDAGGILRISVSTGPHGVSLSKEQQQVYINHYTGAGLPMEGQDGSDELAGTSDQQIADNDSENNARMIPVLQYQQPPEPVQPRDNSHLSLVLQALVILAAVRLFLARKKLHHKNRGSNQ